MSIAFPALLLKSQTELKKFKRRLEKTEKFQNVLLCLGFNVGLLPKIK